MNANRRKFAKDLVIRNGLTPKEAYEATKPLKITGHRKPKKESVK